MHVNNNIDYRYGLSYGKRTGTKPSASFSLCVEGKGLQEEKPVYEGCRSGNYKIVPDHRAGCFDIYNSLGERLGAFSYEHIKIRTDAATGREFLISEHGTMGYDALVLDEELKEDLRKAMGTETLETEILGGYTVKQHAGTGIWYLLRDHEAGRGGKVLLQNEEDRRRYEALAAEYYKKYPNLVHDKNAGYIWADLEIKGLAARSGQGIVSMGFNGMSYCDNLNNKNNWSVLYAGNTYEKLFQWLQDNRSRMEELWKFSVWQKAFAGTGTHYERIWSDEEEKQGYLNN